MNKETPMSASARDIRKKNRFFCRTLECNDTASMTIAFPIIPKIYMNAVSRVKMSFLVVAR